VTARRDSCTPAIRRGATQEQGSPAGARRSMVRGSAPRARIWPPRPTAYCRCRRRFGCLTWQRRDAGTQSVRAVPGDTTRHRTRWRSARRPVTAGRDARMIAARQTLAHLTARHAPGLVACDLEEIACFGAMRDSRLVTFSARCEKFSATLPRGQLLDRATIMSVREKPTPHGHHESVGARTRGERHMIGPLGRVTGSRATPRTR
jgi:hypothetical protein